MPRGHAPTPVTFLSTALLLALAAGAGLALDPAPDRNRADPSGDTAPSDRAIGPDPAAPIVGGARVQLGEEGRRIVIGLLARTPEAFGRVRLPASEEPAILEMTREGRTLLLEALAANPQAFGDLDLDPGTARPVSRTPRTPGFDEENLEDLEGESELEFLERTARAGAMDSMIELVRYQVDAGRDMPYFDLYAHRIAEAAPVHERARECMEFFRTDFPAVYARIRK